MTTRRLVVGISAALAIAWPLQTIGQRVTPTPKAQSDASDLAEILNVWEQEGFVQGGSRTFQLPEASLLEALSGAMILLGSIGAEFTNEDSASEATSGLVDHWKEAFARADPKRVSISRPGDERFALSTTFPDSAGEELGEIVLGTTFVRKGKYLQILLGGGLFDPVADLVKIIAAMDDRWPGDDVWDIVVELDDVPIGMVLMSEEEAP